MCHVDVINLSYTTQSFHRKDWCSILEIFQNGKNVTKISVEQLKTYYTSFSYFCKGKVELIGQPCQEEREIKMVSKKKCSKTIGTTKKGECNEMSKTKGVIKLHSNIYRLTFVSLMRHLTTRSENF